MVFSGSKDEKFYFPAVQWEMYLFIVESFVGSFNTIFKLSRSLIITNVHQYVSTIQLDRFYVRIYELTFTEKQWHVSYDIARNN